MTKEKMICISKCCRLCLSKSNTLVNMKCIASDKISYMSKLLHIVPSLIENPRNDLMVWICEFCRKKLNDAYNFIQNCLKSDALIENYCLQLTSSYTSQNEYEYNNSDDSVFHLTDNNINESIYKPIKEECILEDESCEIEDKQKGFESLFILDKHELPPVNLEIKLESNDPLISYDIPCSFGSIETVPKAYSVVVKGEPNSNTAANDESKNYEMFPAESSLNQGENLPMKKIAESNIPSNTTYKCLSPETEGEGLLEPSRKNAQLQDAATSKLKERPFKCTVCKKSFARNYALYVHLRIHTGERPYECDICQKTYNKAGHLSAHKRIHSGERPYKCDICQKRFNVSGHLNAHKRIHTGERPFQCDICHKTFTGSGDLRKHKRIHSGERRHECEICPKTFNDSGDLIKHMRIHSGERPHECDICQRTFNISGNLIRHKKIHTGERPYECDICQKKFIEAGHLIKHKRLHSGERPYICDICQKGFNSSGHLNRHKKIHNRE